MQVEIIVRGDEEAAELIGRLSQRLADGTSQLRDLVDTLNEVQADRFAGRGARWKRLAPSTIAKDRQQNRDPRPLVLTGHLMRSLTRGGVDQVVRVRPGVLTFGTRVFYARFQKDLGRNPVGASREQRARLVRELRDLLLRDL